MLKKVTAIVLLSFLSFSTLASKTVSVTDENFAYAMNDLAMQKEFALGADNTWYHHRKPMPLNEQPAPLMNRDTLYSFAILDGRGDVKITLPENDGRYMSLHIMNHNHVTNRVLYGPGTYIIPADETSDFYFANVRMQLDASDTADVAKVNDYQDQLKVSHINGYKPESFQVTNWNMKEFNNVRNKYVELAQTEGVTGTMGTVENPVSLEARNRGVAIATGLLPTKDAVYFTAKHDVKENKAYKATYKVPEMSDPKLGFFSITIYGDDQFLKTDQGSILTNKSIKLNADNKTFDVWFVPESEFGQGKYENEVIIPTAPFWSCFRVYMPGKSIISGEYVLPELVELKN